MTPEKLEEIKKLAEAAPLGEWPEDELWGGEDGFCAQGPYHDCPHGGHRNARDVDACNEVLFAAAAADQAFLKKIADRTLPLIEALEEAWKERDDALAEVERTRAAEMVASKLLAEMSTTPAEKRVSDLEWQIAEARGEVERLREVVRQVHSLVSTVRVTAVLDDIEKLHEIHKITKGMVE